MPTLGPGAGINRMQDLHTAQPISRKKLQGRSRTARGSLANSHPGTCRHQILHSSHSSPGTSTHLDINAQNVDKQHSSMPPLTYKSGMEDSTPSYCLSRNRKPVLATHENLTDGFLDQAAGPNLCAPLLLESLVWPATAQGSAQPPKHQPQQCRGPGQQAHRPAWAVTGALPRLSPSPWACRPAARAWRPRRRPPHPHHRRPPHHRRRRPVASGIQI